MEPSAAAAGAGRRLRSMASMGSQASFDRAMTIPEHDPLPAGPASTTCTSTSAEGAQAAPGPGPGTGPPARCLSGSSGDSPTASVTSLPTAAGKDPTVSIN